MDKNPMEDTSMTELFHHDVAMFITMLVLLGVAAWFVKTLHG